MKLAYLDYEFNNIAGAKLNLVSVAIRATSNGSLSYEREYWLHNSDSGKRAAKEFIQKLIDEGYTFVAYVMEAEARSLHALFGYMPKFPAIDLYLEYRCLLNHNNALSYGTQYIKGEVITTTPPPNKWEVQSMSQEELESDGHHKPSFSLAAAVYKLLDVKIDTVEKNEVRDIIIASDPVAIQANRLRIQKYNMSDILHLPPLLNKVVNAHRRMGETTEEWIKYALTRGDYAVRTARMIVAGYPINIEKVTNFTANVKGIINESIQDCLEYSAEVESFRFDKRQDKYVAVEKNIREWVALQGKPNWRKTDGKKISLSRDAFTDWYDSSSNGFAGAYCRHLKTKQSLNGFTPSPTSSKGAFQDYIGQDNRVRPHFGIYGSQSSRSQPSATSYLWLKSKWMQNFLEASAGRALAACDFASQEFLVAGIIAQDDEMIKSYASGDVYLAFGKLANMIPPEGTKETHRRERDICKTVILGLSYGMTESGLAPRLTQAMGVEFTKEQARVYVDLFEQSYPEYMEWKVNTLRSYEERGSLQLSDGWRMGPDNTNFRSVTNFVVQGEGAVILRESVKLCQEAGLVVIATVHDSIVVDIPSGRAQECVGILRNAMTKGFENVMARYGKTVPIRVEGECWSRDIVTPYHENGFTYTKELIHEKAVKEYERYKKYFTLSSLPVSEVPAKKVREKKVPKLTKIKGVSHGVHPSIN